MKILIKIPPYAKVIEDHRLSLKPPPSLPPAAAGVPLAPVAGAPVAGAPAAAPPPIVPPLVMPGAPQGGVPPAAERAPNPEDRFPTPVGTRPGGLPPSLPLSEEARTAAEQGSVRIGTLGTPSFLPSQAANQVFGAPEQRLTPQRQPTRQLSRQLTDEFDMARGSPQPTPTV
jgi:hypothetical protein